MLKKSLLSLAVTASLVGLAGCNISSTTDNAGKTPGIQGENQASAADKVYPLFNPARSVLPVGIDLLFAGTTDGTANAGNDQGNPVKKALNDMDGISTLAPIDVQFNNPIDPASAVAGSTVFLVKLPNASSVGGATNLILPDGVDASSVNPLSLGTIAPFFSTTKADGTAADDSAFAAGTGLPESVAALNLFGANDGIPFGSPSPAPTQTDGILAAQPVAGTDYEVQVIGLDGKANNTIRINPLKPLDSQTKYLVFVTGSVKDASGKKVSASPDYQSITGTNDLVSPSLAVVRTLIDTLEALGGQIITAGGSNLAPLADGIVYSAPFTTTDPDMVLKSMAYPGYWAESGVAKNNPTAAAELIATAEAAGLATAGTGATLITNAQGVGLSEDEATIFAAGFMLSTALIRDTDATAVDNAIYKNPRNRSFELIENITFPGPAVVDQVPLVTLSASSVALGGEKVLVSQGGIELPQYTTTLTDVNAVSSWQANTDIGDFLDALPPVDEVATPPSDSDGTKNVTYRFPFAKQQRTAVVPLIFIEPIDAAKAGNATFDALAAGAGGVDQAVSPSLGNCARDTDAAGDDAKWPVIILQHGFTVHRAGTLSMGAQLAQTTCSVVVAMDLPHHGIAPSSTDRNGKDKTNPALGLTITYNDDTAAVAPFAAAVNAQVTATPASLLAALAERHEGLYLDATNTTQAMTWGDTKAGKSGDYFIQLTNFQRTRDNTRQAVMDMLNLNATLATIDIDGDTVPDLDTSNVSFVGHSLGAITGTTFVAVNNDAKVQLASTFTGTENGLPNNSVLPKIKSAVLATPGGGLTKLLENSQSYGPRIIGGLSALAGIQQGDASFESFMKVFQSTVDSGDPMNFISDLKTGGSSETPAFIIEMIGGGAISAVDADSDLDANADADGDGDNIDSSLSDTFLALGIYPADHVVPNNTTSASQVTARLPLAGTDPMIRLLNSVGVTAAGAGQAQAYPVTKFNQGTHGTFSSADSAAVFTEMVIQTAAFIGSAGTLITVSDDDILDEAP